MRKDIRIIAISTLILVVALTIGINGIKNNIAQIKSFPATVCPGTNIGTSAVDILPNSQTLAATIPSKLNKLKAIKSRSFATNKALLIDGSSVTSISLLQSNGWLAAVNCSISDGDDWFVGGSANVSSKGNIVVVNSGLSSAQVDFVVYSTKAPLTISKTISANSIQYISLDSLNPGEDTIAVNAITRAGRVSIFMLDDRKKGLRTIGADYLSTAPSPSKTLVIPLIPRFNAKTDQILRVVVPGSVDANIKATIFAGDGSFAPSGIDGSSIKAGTVRDIKFKPIVADSSYALKLSSDVPISASVLTNTSGDLIWSTATSPITQVSLQLGGFKPLLRIYGNSIDVDFSWIDVNGKSYSKHLVGTDSIALRPKIGILRAQFSANSEDTYGAMLLNSGSGYAVLPITPGSHLESSVLPRSDARSINRG